VLFDKRRSTLEYATAVGSAHAAPDFQRSPRCPDSDVNISLAAERNGSEGLFGGRIDIE